MHKWYYVPLQELCWTYKGRWTAQVATRISFPLVYSCVGCLQLHYTYPPKLLQKPMIQLPQINLSLLLKNKISEGIWLRILSLIQNVHFFKVYNHACCKRRRGKKKSQILIHTAYTTWHLNVNIYIHKLLTCTLILYIDIHSFWNYVKKWCKVGIFKPIIACLLVLCNFYLKKIIYSTNKENL